MVSPFDAELTHASSHAYMAWAGLGRWSWNFANIDLRRELRERWTPFTHSELVFYRRAAGKRIPIDQCSKGEQPQLPAIRPGFVDTWQASDVELRKAF